MSLRERREILALHRSVLADTDSGALLSLVRVLGSSYRRPGARLLATPDGRHAGTLSGGCLEADLLRRASWKVRVGAVMEHFSTAFDDTAEVPYGLGCGGEVDVLLEPMGTPEAEALILALHETLREPGEARTIVTVLPSHTAGLSRVVMDAQGDVLFATEALATEVIVDLRRVALKAEHGAHLQVATDAGGLTIFVERLEPAQRLVIFGAGEGARPLARMATEMGWTVVVVDARSQHAKPERFPMAERVVVATSALSMPVCAADAVVLMTHSYEQDRKLLAELLPLSPRYLGLQGARHRSALLLEESAVLAGVSLAEAVRRVSTPVGLDLGGDGPEAVALAIVAEVQTVVRGSTPLQQEHRVAARNGMRGRGMSLSEVQELLASGSSIPRVEVCAMYAEVEEAPMTKVVAS